MIKNATIEATTATIIVVEFEFDELFFELLLFEFVDNEEEEVVGFVIPYVVVDVFEEVDEAIILDVVLVEVETEEDEGAEEVEDEVKEEEVEGIEGGNEEVVVVLGVVVVV